MSLASNLLALALVVGLSWGAMVMLSAHFHGARRERESDLFHEAAREGFIGEPRGKGPTPAPPTTTSERCDGVAPRQSVNVPRDLPCSGCNGSGAQTERGRLQPCPRCEGTGVY